MIVNFLFLAIYLSFKFASLYYSQKLWKKTVLNIEQYYSPSSIGVNDISCGQEQYLFFLCMICFKIFRS